MGKPQKVKKAQNYNAFIHEKKIHQFGKTKMLK